MTSWNSCKKASISVGYKCRLGAGAFGHATMAINSPCFIQAIVNLRKGQHAAFDSILFPCWLFKLLHLHRFQYQLHPLLKGVCIPISIVLHLAIKKSRATKKNVACAHGNNITPHGLFVGIPKREIHQAPLLHRVRSVVHPTDTVRLQMFLNG